MKLTTDALDETARRFSEKTALIDQEGTTTFAEFRRQARAIATALARRNIFHAPVVVFLGQTRAAVISFLGVAYAGAFYTVLDAKMPKVRQAKILETLSPAAIITDQAHRGRLMDPGEIPVLFYEDLFRQEIEETLLASVREKVSEQDILYVLFTSGSTGTPKGVTIRQRSVMDYTEWVRETFAVTEKDIIGNQAPFFFDNSVLDIYQTVRNGATLCIIPRKAFIFPIRLLEYVRDHHISLVFWVPSVLCSVANLGILNDCDISCLKKILFAGEVMPNKQLNLWRKRLPKAVFANLYGPTEVTVDCTYYIVDRPFRDDEPLPIGRECRPETVFVLDEEDRRIMQPELKGELCVRGASLALGYYKNPEKTEAVFVQNPLRKEREIIYRTGDIVHYNMHGELMYDGRKDFQIKYMGHRIELGEIETAAAALPDIHQAVCLYDAEASEIVLCYVGETEPAAVYRALRDLLPDYMLPKITRQLDRLPLTANGKFDRKELMRSYAQDKRQKNQ